MKKNNVLLLVLGMALSCNAMVAMNQPITNDNNNQEQDEKRGMKRKRDNSEQIEKTEQQIAKKQEIEKNQLSVFPSKLSDLPSELIFTILQFCYGDTELLLCNKDLYNNLKKLQKEGYNDINTHEKNVILGVREKITSNNKSEIEAYIIKYGRINLFFNFSSNNISITGRNDLKKLLSHAIETKDLTDIEILFNNKKYLKVIDFYKDTDLCINLLKMLIKNNFLAPLIFLLKEIMIQKDIDNKLINTMVGFDELYNKYAWTLLHEDAYRTREEAINNDLSTNITFLVGNHISLRLKDKSLLSIALQNKTSTEVITSILNFIHNMFRQKNKKGVNEISSKLQSDVIPDIIKSKDFSTSKKITYTKCLLEWIHIKFSQKPLSIDNGIIKKIIKHLQSTELLLLLVTMDSEKIQNFFKNHNYNDTNKETWLHFAAKENMIDFAKFLINNLETKDLKINELNTLNNTALHYACEKQNPDMQLLLLNAGADATIKDWNDSVPNIDAKVMSTFKLEQEKKQQEEQLKLLEQEKKNNRYCHIQ